LSSRLLRLQFVLTRVLQFKALPILIRGLHFVAMELLLGGFPVVVASERGWSHPQVADDRHADVTIRVPDVPRLRFVLAFDRTGPKTAASDFLCSER
jgi:hypothetical protein